MVIFCRRVGPIGTYSAILETRTVSIITSCAAPVFLVSNSQAHFCKVNKEINLLNNLNELVCKGHHNDTLQTGGLKQQQLLFPQFWNLEVQDQGPRILVSSEASLRGSWLVVFSPVFTWSSLCWVCVLIFL